MNVQVAISGPVFAQMMHEHSISSNNQEGLLLGESVFRLVNQINDQAAVNEQQETVIKICSFVPCNSFDFYDQNFIIDPHKIAELIARQGSKDLRVVGFYSFRRNLPLKATYRERIIAAELCNLVNGNPFILGLFSTSYNENFSIHSMEHVFINLREFENKRFNETASLRIINLGEDAGHEYKTMAALGVSESDGPYANLLKNFEYSSSSDSNVRLINGLHKDIQTRLKRTAHQIIETVQIIGLTQEIQKAAK